MWKGCWAACNTSPTCFCVDKTPDLCVCVERECVSVDVDSCRCSNPRQSDLGELCTLPVSGCYFCGTQPTGAAKTVSLNLTFKSSSAKFICKNLLKFFQGFKRLRFKRRRKLWFVKVRFEEVFFSPGVQRVFKRSGREPCTSIHTGRHSRQPKVCSTITGLTSLRKCSDVYSLGQYGCFPHTATVWLSKAVFFNLSINN